jgi:uncharacterized membrane protein (Fun14 family)
MNLEYISSFGTTIGAGFFVGALVGYALKKVVKIVAIVIGLFFAGLEYLQYQHIVNINWNNLQQVSKNAAITILNATKYIPGFTNVNGHTTYLILSDFGIPLTGSMSMGFAIAFLKG